jgi:hypothetical protein
MPRDSRDFTTYDAEGNPLTAATTVAPDRDSLGTMARRYTYDLADRRLTDSVGTKLARRERGAHRAVHH